MQPATENIPQTPFKQMILLVEDEAIVRQVTREDLFQVVTVCWRRVGRIKRFKLLRPQTSTSPGPDYFGYARDGRSESVQLPPAFPPTRLGDYRNVRISGARYIRESGAPRAGHLPAKTLHRARIGFSGCQGACNHRAWKHCSQT